jgi:hypothetical protein
LLEVLQLDDPIDELRRRVIGLRGNLIASLDPAMVTPDARIAELMRLHGLVRQRYAEVAGQPTFSNLVEDPVLLPK